MNTTKSMVVKVNPQTVYEKNMTRTILRDVKVIDDFDNIDKEGMNLDGCILIKQDQKQIEVDKIKNYFKQVISNKQ